MHFSPTILEQLTRDHHRTLLAEADRRRLARLARGARVECTPCAARRPLLLRRFLIGQRRPLPC